MLKETKECFHKSKKPMQPKDNFPSTSIYSASDQPKFLKRTAQEHNPLSSFKMPTPHHQQNIPFSTRSQKRKKKKYLSTTKIPRKKLAMQNRKTHLGEKPLVGLWGLVRPIRAQKLPKLNKTPPVYYLEIKSIKQKNPIEPIKEEARGLASPKEKEDSDCLQNIGNWKNGFCFGVVCSVQRLWAEYKW